ncbi:carbonate dehydratase [bacterium]|nr:carbonate dehydratase [bacterium]MBU1074395.1 carbonate dehydratase [bacterium]MBU1675305.1 carbonate dehydratase [bacterium]
MNDVFRTLLQPNPAGHLPLVDTTAWLHPTAQLIGKVRVGADVMICANAVLRADETTEDGRVAPVEIGPGSNVQEGAIVHALAGTPVVVGQGVSLAHGCVVHGPCLVSDGCFVGFRAVVFHANLGEGVMVSAGAVVQGVDLPAGVHVPPGAAVTTEEEVAVLRRVTPEERALLDAIAAENQELLTGYRRVFAGG